MPFCTSASLPSFHELVLCKFTFFPRTFCVSFIPSLNNFQELRHFLQITLRNRHFFPPKTTADAGTAFPIPPLQRIKIFLSPVPSIQQKLNCNMADDCVVKIITVVWKRQRFLLLEYNHSFYLFLSCFGRFFELLLRGGYLGILRVPFRGQDYLGYVRLRVYVLIALVMAHTEGSFALDAIENWT